MKKTALLLLATFTMATAWAQKSFELTLTNESKTAANRHPICLQLKDYDLDTKSALVTSGGREIPCQLDDLDGNGTYDELFFMTDLDKRESKTFQVVLYDTGSPKQYDAQVYVDMMLTNNKIKESNKQNLYIQSLTVDRGVNPYSMLHHHGAAFENELVAYRIYFDHRQTVDIYGKYRKGLELKQTQFYPDKEQAANGYGDDVLWVGNTLGLGTLRGWDVPGIDNFTKAISNTISRYFGDVWPEVLLEPGRFIVGKAGVVYTEAVLVSTRGARNGVRWVYLDIGRFGGLAETENESIRYAIHAWRGFESDFYREKELDLAPVVLAGPTCDGADILYEKAHYMLPQDLKSGDKLIILSAGAYVSTYCSTCFNGFPPLAEYYI